MKMLIDSILSFCNSEYTKQDTTKKCSKCVHPVNCSGGCEYCLKQIHFHEKNGMPDYLCKNIINFYACKFLYRYSSEIQYILRESESLEQIEDYHIISVGCGASPDLMALENLLGTVKDKKIKYLGFDINVLWKPIHEQIEKYTDQHSTITAKFWYEDAIKYLQDNKIENTNILILQYVISHFYKANEIDKINSFFNNIIKNIVMEKEQGVPFIIIINDANSCYTGRDTYNSLIVNLEKSGFKLKVSKFYFDNNIVDDEQRYGKKHDSYSVLYQIPEYLVSYHPGQKCSGAQLLVEIN